MKIAIEVNASETLCATNGVQCQKLRWKVSMANLPYPICSEFKDTRLSYSTEVAGMFTNIHRCDECLKAEVKDGKD